MYLEISHNYSLPINNLPDSIGCISFGDHYSGQIVELPKRIKKLKYSKNFRYYFPTLPDTLTTIELYYNYTYIDEIMQKYNNIEFIILQ